MRLRGPQGWSGRVQKISPKSGFDPRSVQPVASRYTDWAIAVHCPQVHYKTDRGTKLYLHVPWHKLTVSPSLTLFSSSCSLSRQYSSSFLWGGRSSDTLSNFLLPQQCPASSTRSRNWFSLWISALRSPTTPTSDGILISPTNVSKSMSPVWVPWELYSVSSKIPLSCKHSVFFSCFLILSPSASSIFLFVSTLLSVNGKTVAMILLDSDELRSAPPYQQSSSIRKQTHCIIKIRLKSLRSWKLTWRRANTTNTD